MRLSSWTLKPREATWGRERWGPSDARAASAHFNFKTKIDRCNRILRMKWTAPALLQGRGGRQRFWRRPELRRAPSGQAGPGSAAGRAGPQARILALGHTCSQPVGSCALVAHLLPSASQSSQEFWARPARSSRSAARLPSICSRRALGSRCAQGRRRGDGLLAR